MLSGVTRLDIQKHQVWTCLAGLHIGSQQNPLMSPIGWDLTHPHEPGFMSGIREKRIGAKTGQGLTEASARLGGEIAGAEVFGRAVESISRLGKIQILASRRIGEF